MVGLPKQHLNRMMFGFGYFKQLVFEGLLTCTAARKQGLPANSFLSQQINDYLTAG